MKNKSNEFLSRLRTGWQQGRAQVSIFLALVAASVKRQFTLGADKVQKKVYEKILDFFVQVIMLLIAAAFIIGLSRWGVDPRDWWQNLTDPKVEHVFTGCVEDKESGMAIPGIRVGIVGESSMVKTDEDGAYELRVFMRRTKEVIYLKAYGNEVYLSQLRGKSYPEKGEPSIIDFQLTRDSGDNALVNE